MARVSAGWCEAVRKGKERGVGCRATHQNGTCRHIGQHTKKKEITSPGISVEQVEWFGFFVLEGDRRRFCHLAKSTTTEDAWTHDWRSPTRSTSSCRLLTGQARLSWRAAANKKENLRALVRVVEGVEGAARRSQGKGTIKKRKGGQLVWSAFVVGGRASTDSAKTEAGQRPHEPFTCRTSPCWIAACLLSGKKISWRCKRKTSA